MTHLCNLKKLKILEIGKKPDLKKESNEFNISGQPLGYTNLSLVAW